MSLIALMRGFDQAYVGAIMKGLRGEAAVAEAARVAPGAEADLMLRGAKLGTELEAWHAEPKASKKAAIKRKIYQMIPQLYAHDLCPEHMGWIKEAVVTQCKRDKHESWGCKMGQFHEKVDKWIRKSGCNVCPIHKRDDW